MPFIKQSLNGRYFITARGGGRGWCISSLYLIFAMLVIGLAAGAAPAATVTSAASGYWNDTGTWAGGTVQMAPARTFWATRFGMVTDRFGVAWMVSLMP